MNKLSKPVESLTVADIAANPVWEYTNSNASGESLVRAVKNIPVKNLIGKLIGARVGLGNCSHNWALIGNIDAHNPRLTEHFVTLSLERAGKWFSLARYHDYDYSSRGPEALSQFLGLQVDEVFPISFDVRQYARGDPASLAQRVYKEPRQRLSRAEIIAMAVP